MILPGRHCLLWPLLATGLAGGYASSERAEADSRVAALRQQVQELSRHRDLSQDEHAGLPALAALYRTLQQRGVVGAPPAPDGWQAELEALRPLTTDLHYELGPAHPADGGFQLAPVTLHFSVRHEGHLLALLDQLRASDAGWFVVERCATERQEAGLAVECHGGWLTLAPLPPA